MNMEDKITWIVVDIPWEAVRDSMGRGVKIPCIGGQNTMGRGFDILMLEG